MERLHFRSTSLIDIQAELRERDLLREVGPRRRAPEPRGARRARRRMLGILGRRILG